MKAHIHISTQPRQKNKTTTTKHNAAQRIMIHSYSKGGGNARDLFSYYQHYHHHDRDAH